MVKKALDVVTEQLAVRRDASPFAPRTANDGRPLGLVIVRFLRGNRAPHDPLATRALQVRAALAASLSPHVTPDGEESGNRDKRWPEAIGVGAKSSP
jgi:hypothetical protein